MITVKLMGGLGNQMFQYAFGFALAKRNKMTLILDIGFLKRTGNWTTRNYELEQLSISKNKICSKDSLIHRISRKIYKSRNYFEGYFQSEKYFADCVENIRREFQFKERLLIPEGNTVAIHIRRGDYVKFADIHLVCPPIYYENAIAYIQSKVENPVFYVFSEDLKWVKQNINIPSNAIFVDYNPNLPSSHDMQFMSLCKHQIISNSSYSWWAAWLNQNSGKIVVAPDKWFNDGRDMDIYTDYMVRVSTKNYVL
jgi:hypothetical protein